jgi:serine/threonine-protein kinase
MEYVPGKSLEKIRTTEPERITLPFLLDITIALAGALDHAWKKFHVFHGDIKPDNLLIRDGDGILKLADLGLAKIVGKDDLATDIMATPLYASPEVILADASNIGIKSDIYSFGIMLYELLTGKAPFRGNVESVLRQHVDKDPVPLEKASPGLDRELAAFINRMIAKAPADRPHDWEEIKNVLQQIRARTPDSGKSKSSRRIPGKQVLSLILSIIFLILAAGIAFAVFKLF